MRSSLLQRRKLWNWKYRMKIRKCENEQENVENKKKNEKHTKIWRKCKHNKHFINETYKLRNENIDDE